MKELFQNNQNNQTEITDTKSVKNIWLGMRDSNPRMPGPKPGALPLGQFPLISALLLYSKINIFCIE
jgi:hypothetical protein